MAFCIGVLPLSHILQGNFPEATEKVKSFTHIMAKHLLGQIPNFPTFTVSHGPPHRCKIVDQSSRTFVHIQIHPKLFQGQNLSVKAQDELDSIVFAGRTNGGTLT